MIKDIDNRLVPFLKKLAKNELIKQGHKLTGKLYKSAFFVQRKKGNDVDLEAYYENYGEYMNNGVKGSRINYTRGSGRKTSKYIDALEAYAKARNMTNPKSAAFAIAAKHKKEGMCTRKSSKYSKNGKRTGSFDDVLANPKVTDMIDDIMGDTVEVTINNILKDNERL